MEYFTLLLAKYGYWILFPLAAIEGPIVSLAVGFLVFLGYFQFLPAYGILILGDLIPDTIYYYIGRFGKGKNFLIKYGRYFKITEEHEKSLEHLWHNHGKKTMFFGKLAYGLSVPFLISAGLAKVPVKKFWLYTLPVTLFQYGLLMTIGYFFGQSYNALIGHYFQYAEIIIAVLIIFFFLIFYVARKWFFKYIIRE